jgi:hypothetical protein
VPPMHGIQHAAPRPPALLLLSRAAPALPPRQALEAAKAKKESFKQLQLEAKKNPPKRVVLEAAADEADVSDEVVKDVGVTLVVQEGAVSLELRVSETDA